MGPFAAVGQEKDDRPETNVTLHKHNEGTGSTHSNFHLKKASSIRNAESRVYCDLHDICVCDGQCAVLLQAVGRCSARRTSVVQQHRTVFSGRVCNVRLS